MAPYPFDDSGMSTDYIVPEDSKQERTSSDPLTKLYHKARDQGMSKREARSAAFAAVRGVEPPQRTDETRNSW